MSERDIVHELVKLGGDHPIVKHVGELEATIERLEKALDTERRAGDWKCKCKAPLVVCRDCWQQKCDIVNEQRDVIIKQAGTIERLPVTKDGATIVPGVKVFCLHVNGVGIYELEVIGIRDRVGVMRVEVESPDRTGRFGFRNTIDIGPENCFSTREAAEAAKERRGSASTKEDGVSRLHEEVGGE